MTFSKSAARPFGQRDGQAIVLMVVAMSLFLIGVLGFAIDGSQMYAQRQLAQTAADAAAQAGILSILDGTNTTAPAFGVSTTTYVCTATDGRTPCWYARNNGFGATASDTVTLIYPGSVSGVTLSSVAVPALEVTVQRNVQTAFIGFLGGPATTSVTAKAIAGITTSVSPDSIIVLDPSAKDAFQVTGASVVTVTGGGIAIDSSNAEAGLISGSSQVIAASVGSIGGVSITGTSTSTPAPVTLPAAVADPLLSLAAPTIGSCAAHPTNTSPPNGTSTLLPGTYCGGITIGGIANVTFSPGNYIINGGGISFGNSSISNGNGVMFYLTGSSPTVIASGASIVNFTAPTSGTYQGILFYQDRTIASASNAQFGNSAAVTFSGTLYFPKSTVTFSGAAETSSNMAVVADKVTFAGSSNITYDPMGLKTGLFSPGAVSLMQ